MREHKKHFPDQITFTKILDFILSLLIHGAFFVIFTFLMDQGPNAVAPKIDRAFRINLSSLYRNKVSQSPSASIGKASSSKESFAPAKKKFKSKSKNKTRALKSTGLNLSTKIQANPRELTQTKFVPLYGQDLKSITNHNLLSSPEVGHIQAFKNSRFDIGLEPIEGLSEDEFNKIEQIFYSFSKRNFSIYASSILQNLEIFFKNYPNYFQLNPINENIIFLARVTFDKDGYAITRQILRTSPEKPLKEFFENVIDGIYRLPNPPKKIVEISGEFSMFYKITIHR